MAKPIDNFPAACTTWKSIVVNKWLWVFIAFIVGIRFRDSVLRPSFIYSGVINVGISSIVCMLFDDLLIHFCVSIILAFFKSVQIIRFRLAVDKRGRVDGKTQFGKVAVPRLELLRHLGLRKAHRRVYK